MYCYSQKMVCGKHCPMYNKKCPLKVKDWVNLSEVWSNFKKRLFK